MDRAFFGASARRHQEHGFLVALVRAADEILCIRKFVGMRDTRGVLGDAAVVGERRNGFSVLEARPAQGQPRGLKDGNTAFPKSLSW